MENILAFFEIMGGISTLTYDFFKSLFRKGVAWRLLSEQIFQIGHRSLPLVIITAASTGMVYTLQFGFGLERFGGTLYVPRIVTLSILREMSPVFIGLIVAARVGAGMASEIGSMAVTQQIDAIRAMGTSPIEKIVIPRVLACVLALPILIAVANIVGFFSSLLVAHTELRIDPQFYILKAITNLKPSDYLSGFGKSFFFAFFIALPSCFFGLNVKEGTKEVGIATRKAVVTGSICVLVGDFFLTKLFWVIETWL